MENWGLVTYRESSLFYNEKSDTIENKIRVAKVIAHELAHQWYGNLVTMEWWNDLWLNEGFASWVENLGLNRTHPEWRHVSLIDSMFEYILIILKLLFLYCLFSWTTFSSIDYRLFLILTVWSRAMPSVLK